MILGFAEGSFYFYLGCGFIFLVGLIIFFVLANRTHYRHPIERISDIVDKSESTKHYEQMRDEITDNRNDVEEEDEPEEEEDSEYNSNASNFTGGGMIGGIITSVLGLAIVFGVGYVVLSNVTSVVSSMNTTGLPSGMETSTITVISGLIPIIVILGIIMVLMSVFRGGSGEINTTKKANNTRSDNNRHYEGKRDAITRARMRKSKQRRNGGE